MRDNRLDDAEAASIGLALGRENLKIAKLMLAGNRIGAVGLAAISKGLVTKEELADGTVRLRSSSIVDLDLSRNPLCWVRPSEAAATSDKTSSEGTATADAVKQSGESDGGTENDETNNGLLSLADAMVRSVRLTTLSLSRCGLRDSAGAMLCHELLKLAPQPAAAGCWQGHSHRNTGLAFAQALDISTASIHDWAAGVANSGSHARRMTRAGLPPGLDVAKGSPPMALARLDLSNNELGYMLGACSSARTAF